MADVTGRSRGRSRGVSTTVGYVLNLAVALVLVTTLLTAAGSFVEDQRQRATQDELTVVGERVVAGLTTAQRLADRGDAVRISLDLPRTVAGNPYQVHVDAANQRLVLSTDRNAFAVQTAYPAVVSVAETTVNGGDIVIRLTDSGSLEVENA